MQDNIIQKIESVLDAEYKKVMAEIYFFKKDCFMYAIDTRNTEFAKYLPCDEGNLFCYLSLDDIDKFQECRKLLEW